MADKKIVITGGGTAGHITPLIAVAKEIYAIEPNAKIIYIGQRGDRSESLVTGSDLPIEIKRIFAGKYRRYPSQGKLQKVFNIKRHILNVRDLLYFFFGFLQSLILIKKINPDVVFMKGGYVGVPVGFASGVLGKKLITHDSDAIPGLANRLVSRFVSIHAVATDYNIYPKSKTIVTGIPVRQEYYDYSKKDGQTRAKKELGFKNDDQILFVGGSTQGAKKIDDVIEQITPKLLNNFPKLHIIQVFGRLNEASMKQRYSGLNDNLLTRLHTFEFLHDNYRYMTASDVLIGRAGATFIAEAGVLGSACIIIPAPHLAGGHQVENGLVLSQSGAAIVIEEKDLDGNTLYVTIEELIKSKDKRRDLGQALKSLQHTDSAKILAKIILGEKP